MGAGGGLARAEGLDSEPSPGGEREPFCKFPDTATSAEK
jgi:hypothetical protein